MNKLANMEMFVRVVESGSFAAAAEASRVSATMVAKHINDIEQRLGARLLHRTTRRQQLSDVGRLYYERCKHVLAEVALAEASASELHATPRGQLRVVAPVSFGSHILAPALSDYMANYPDISVELTLDNRRPNLVDGGFDLGIYIGDINEPGIVARPLRPYRRMLAASASYLDRRGRPEHPEQLSAHDCLGLSYWRRFDQWLLVGPGGATCQVTVRGRFTANQGNALRIAALNGAGIVLQPEAVLADDLDAGRLLPVLPEWSLLPSPMYLIYAQDARPTAKLRSAIDFLLARINT
ncbi:LysR family transcriptional regulator [Dyella nitratireducens]|uniref:LysR family transcriptional regulator n=1 Tax=Dyella nitratireducens TaxID=1849580 RepID=A0ABQ1FSF7_9GAMM|nr:LysR family transcriptional regulator [Dyella nitratireducens]GGA29258.1 LysR family transcriptional regulator [Dyella nitratireducens]GLQ43167.1 LysR family transcriptional regulator [Dyella nitratireducens]